MSNLVQLTSFLLIVSTFRSGNTIQLFMWMWSSGWPNCCERQLWLTQVGHEIHTVCFLAASGIQCYRCLPKAGPVTVNQTSFSEPCAQFDGSSKFVIDCPLSTFCMKRNFTLEFPDGSEFPTFSKCHSSFWINFSLSRECHCDWKGLRTAEFLLQGAETWPVADSQRCQWNYLPRWLRLGTPRHQATHPVLLLLKQAL